MKTGLASRLVACLLALSLALAPAVPVFAAMGAGHHDTQGAHNAHSDLGHLHAPPAVSADSCYKHQDCNGHCCLACAMHCVSILSPEAAGSYARPLQVPIVRHYHSRTVITLPDRPPRQLI